MNIQSSRTLPLAALFCACGDRTRLSCLVSKEHDSTFISRVELAYQLSRCVDTNTSVMKSPLLSEITGRPISLKLDYELCGWATKTRGVWGLVAERLDGFLIPDLLHPDDSPPLGNAIKEAFNNATVVACTSGNHGIATAQLLNLLSYRYEFDIDLEILIPEDTPAAKREHLEELGVKITTYSPEEDRVSRMNEICAQLKRKGIVSLPFPTEPIVGHEGGLAGLGTLGREISDTFESGITVFLPASSGPTAAAVLRYFKDTNSPHAVHIAQDISNGCLADIFFNEATIASHLPFETSYARGKMLNDMRECGKAVNGLSTRHVNDVAANIFKAYLTPDQLTFVTPTLMAVAALIVYLETRSTSEGMKPELAGACSVAGLLSRALQDRNSRYKLRDILETSDFTWEQLAAIAEISEEALTKAISEPPPLTYLCAPEPSASLCVITGANCRQPYFLALQAGDSELAIRERELAHPLYQAQIAYGWQRMVSDVNKDV